MDDMHQHLEEQQREDYKLLKQLEDMLRWEKEPRLIGKWENEIKDVKQRISDRETEIKSLSERQVCVPAAKSATQYSSKQRKIEREEKESLSSFNFKAFPTALMAGSMVLIAVVGSLLYLQTLQQHQAVVFKPPSNVKVAPTFSTNNILCSVRSRSIINIYESTGEWFKTNVCGQIGYIHRSQIKTNLDFNFYSQKPVNISRVGVAMVIEPPSNIRYTPNGNIICSVNDNRHINIYNLVGEWYKTDFCGSVGYIHKSQVDF